LILHFKKQNITKCPNERNAISDPISSPIAIIAIPRTAAAKINEKKI
jgi:hypothetical protein